ncbi:MAG TPA: hypothetical protein VFP34_17640 [Microlunatus sp.]|nr:hypothetical protein [Microlunatus sp.]
MSTAVQLPSVAWRHIPGPSINSLVGSGAVAATDEQLTAVYWTGGGGSAWLQSSSTTDLQTWQAASVSNVGSSLQSPAVSAAVWNGVVYAGMVDETGGPQCVVISTSSPVGLPTPGPTTGTPVLTAGTDGLFAVYSASSALWCVSSSDTKSWGGPYQIPGAATTGDPAVTVYNGRVHVFFVVGTGSNMQLLHTSSVDGVSWRAPVPVGSPPVTGATSGSGAGVFNGMLYVGGQITGSSGLGYVASVDGETWSDVQPVPGLAAGAGYSPCLASTDTALYWLAQHDGDTTLPLLQMTLD